MPQFCLVLILLSLHAKFSKLTTTKANYVQEMILKCGIEIANENFSYRQTTVVINSSGNYANVNTFLKEYKGSVVVDVYRYTVSVGQVVIILDSYQSFVNILGKLKPDLKGKTLLSSGSRFLILLLTNPEQIKRINNFLWNYYVTDVVIVTGLDKNVALYTYYPYQSHLNCRNTESTLISFWNETNKPKTVFGNKLQNMNECPLYISTNKINYPLAENKMPLEIIKKTIIRFLRDVMNFTPIVTTKDYISIDSVRAKNWSDSLSDVLSGVANISTCTIPLGIDVLGLLDYSMPYFRVRLAWLAPPAFTGPGYWRLLSPLNGYLWLLLLIVVFFVKSLPFIINIKPVRSFCYRYFKRTRNMTGTVFRSWGVMMGQPVRMAPKRFRDFYIIGLWVWFTFVVRNAYQSVLIGALKTDKVLGNFANLNEAIENGYEIGGRAGINAHFEFDPLISERFIVIQEQNFEDVLRDVIEGKRKFVLATSLEYAYAYCIDEGRKEKECGYTLPDNIMSVPLVVWMKKHSPFWKQFSVWIPRLIETGMFLKDEMVKGSFCCQISSDPTPLTRHQMFSCMICLLLGSGVSFIVFIFEVFRFRIDVYIIERRRPFLH